MDNSNDPTVAAAATAITWKLPMGTIVAYALQGQPPHGWLLCDGSAIPAQYQALSSALGSDYTPNLTARVLIGSGTTPNNNSTQTDGLTPNFPYNKAFDLGNTGGEYVHTLTTDEMPAHSHSINNANGGFGLHYRSFQGNSGKDQPFENNPDGINVNSTDNSGGGSSHNTMQPYYVIKYIIYTGV